MSHHRVNSFYAGQVGLVVLLVGAVLMTIGLGAISRSVTESKTARQETESSQAFNAAEQGIEEALKQSLESADSLQAIDTQLSDMGYKGNYTVSKQNQFVGTILSGHSAQINLDSYQGTIQLSWKDKGGCGKGNAALVVTMIKSSGALTRTTYARSCATRSDNFNTAGVTCDGNVCTVSNVAAQGYTLARVTAVYADTELSVSGDGTFPTQSYKITSTATKDVGTTESGAAETRSVEVNRSLPAVPSVFDYALFSGGSIVQLEKTE